MSKQFLKSLARNHDRVEGTGCAKSCIAWLFRKQRRFSKDVAVSQSCQGDAVALRCHLSFDDEVHFVTGVAFAEDRFSVFKMLAVHVRFVKEPQLGDVPRQESI